MQALESTRSLSLTGLKMPNGTTMHEIGLSAVKLILGASLGFGVSQMWIGAQVNKATQDITYLWQSSRDISARYKDDSDATNARINNLSGLAEKQIDLNRELVQLIRVQNELLTRERK